MALFRLQRDYFNQLSVDNEFEKDEKRLYYVVRQVEYKGEKITVAIPLRSNINPNFQKNPDEYIPTPPSPKTQTQKGNVAGWHIVKMIPIDFAETITVRNLNIGLQIAEGIVTQYSKQVFIDNINKMLRRFEQGEKVFGAIDFDAALEKLKLRQKQRSQAVSLENKKAESNALNAEKVVSQTRSVPSLTALDKEVIQKIRNSVMGQKFNTLMDGSVSDISKSSFELLNTLAFFSNQNKGTMERIFKNSKLYDGDDNKLNKTIGEVIAGFFSGSGSGSGAGSGVGKGRGNGGENYR